MGDQRVEGGWACRRWRDCCGALARHPQSTIAPYVNENVLMTDCVVKVYGANRHFTTRGMQNNIDIQITGRHARNRRKAARKHLDYKYVFEKKKTLRNESKSDVTTEQEVYHYSYYCPALRSRVVTDCRRGDPIVCRGSPTACS